jgi:cytochrome P450
MSDQSGDPPTQIKYDLLSPSFFADPHSLFHRLRAEEPIHWHPQLNFWLLTRYEDIQVISRDPRFSAERTAQFANGVSEAMAPKLEAWLRFVSHWIVFRDPPRHTLLRGLVAKAFTPQVIEGLRPAIKGIVDEMLTAVEGGGQMDVVRDLAFPLPAMVIASMLGVPRRGMDAFKAWTTDVFTLFGAGVATDDAVEAGHRGVVGLQEFFRHLIAARRQTPTNDLLSRLINVEEQGTVLSEEELVSTCALLLVAGHETTTHLIGNSVLALLRNPVELQKLRKNPGLIEGAVEELLRYEGPIYMLSRRATEDVEVGAVKIRANEVVVGLIHAGNRDPAVFKDPDRLDITRKGARNLALGHGIHYCIGAALARLEAQVALSAIIARLPELRLASEELEWIPSIAVHGLAALPVTFGHGAEEGLLPEDSSGWEGPVSLRGPHSPLSMRSPVSVPTAPMSTRAPRI